MVTIISLFSVTEKLLRKILLTIIACSCERFCPHINILLKMDSRSFDTKKRKLSALLQSIVASDGSMLKYPIGGQSISSSTKAAMILQSSHYFKLQTWIILLQLFDSDSNFSKVPIEKYG